MKYWLICYWCEQRATGHTSFQNCVATGSIATWIVDTRKKYGAKEDYVLVSAVEITKEEYDLVKDNI